MAVNPDRIKRYGGDIIKVIGEDKNGLIKNLTLTVKRLEDGFEDHIFYTHHVDQLGDGKFDEDTSKVPESVRDIYEDFKISEYSELIGKKVVGLYYTGFEETLGVHRLVGIEKLAS